MIWQIQIGKIVDEIFKFLIDRQEIETRDLLEIFAKCNSYIVDLDDKDVSNHLENDISQVIRAINLSYKVAKTNFIWKKKVEENQKNMSRQLDGVSKAIKKMAKGIENEIQTETQYQVQERQITELLKIKGIRNSRYFNKKRRKICFRSIFRRKLRKIKNRTNRKNSNTNIRRKNSFK